MKPMNVQETIRSLRRLVCRHEFQCMQCVTAPIFTEREMEFQVAFWVCKRCGEVANASVKYRIGDDEKRHMSGRMLGSELAVDCSIETPLRSEYRQKLMESGPIENLYRQWWRFA